MEALLVLTSLALIGLPVVALVLSVVQFARGRQLHKRADAQAQVLMQAQSDLAALRERIRRLEGRGVPIEDTTPTNPPDETPSPAAPAMETSSAGPTVAADTPPARVAPSSHDIERQFGTRVVVWVGAIALALAGAFLVKYSFERGLIGPAARLALGLAFGGSLIGVGEGLRRRYAGLAQGLVAAGVAVLYAALLAGVKLYALFPPAVGLLGMALTTAAAVGLSMRHGQLVAVLGLLGGFLTPLLVGSNEPRPWMLLLYVAFLQCGLLVVSRKMKWWPIAGLTLLGAMSWALLWMADLATFGGSTLHVGLLLVSSMVSLVVAAGASFGASAWGDDKAPRALVWGGIGLGTLLTAALVGVGDFGWVEWTFLGTVGAGCIVLGRRQPRYEGLAWIASLAGAALLLVWGIQRPSGEQSTLWTVAIAMTTLYVGGAGAALWGSVKPQRWAGLASVSGIVYLLAAYAAIGDASLPIPWGAQALALGTLLAGLAVPAARQRETHPQGTATLAALVVGATVLVSLAVPLELERAWISVAWALAIPALAWSAARLRLPQLERLAWVFAGVVALRLLLNPAIVDYPIGDGVLFNWLLYGYGVPLGAFLAGAALFRRSAAARLADALEIGAILLGFAYITLEIRQYFHPGDLAAFGVDFAELGAFTALWLAYGIGLLALHATTRRPTHLFGGVTAGLVALGHGVLVCGLVQNPLTFRHPVGNAPVFNLLLLVYGLPAALAVVFARALQQRGLRAPAVLSGSAALVLTFLTLTLEVRQGFHGGLLQGTTRSAEMYTYSLVWVLFALALLVAGIVRGGVVLRYGSAVVMTLAVGKVFLVDTAQLHGLYRVLSLFGLGVTLMVLGFLYQRFVFREDEAKA